MKGIIVAAGYGTRFLPFTKTIPKEMIPLVNKPSIAFIAEEFIASGITDIIIITSRRKKTLEDYFDREMELETIFTAEKDNDKLELIRPYDARISFVRQQEMKGTGHALLQVKPLVGGEPCVVAYPDDLHFGSTPLAAQLISVYKKSSCSVLATLHNPPNLERYGVLELAEDNFHVKKIIEKPAPGKEPSREASIGRYLYTPEFFDWLEEGWKKHTKGEYYHIYALNKLMEQNNVVFCATEGKRLDTGEPSGYLEAVIEYAKNDPTLREVLKKALREL
ncbi:MAG: UTP--glucose-1-phosphate uridylyltransferase [Spirochaetales bacterium]|nr:UTP--glucose-1-phosphate uridylyltransferase [Spirochaetales bacterium]